MRNDHTTNESNELPKVLRRATTLLVPVGSYFGDLEAYTTSEGLVLVTKEDRFGFDFRPKPSDFALFSNGYVGDVLLW